MSELTTADELDYTDGAMLAGRDESATGTKKGLLSGLAAYISIKLFGAMTGQAGKVPTVNVTEDAFEWGDGGGGASYPSFTGNEGRFLAVNVTEDDVEWVDPPAGSGTTLTAGATVYRSGSLVVPADTPTVIEFDTEEYDNGGYFTIGQPTRLTAIYDGWYVISAFLDAPVTNDDLVAFTLTKNGTDPVAEGYDLGTGEVVQLNLLSVVHLAAGDYIEASVYCETAGLEVLCRFSMATFGDGFPDIAGKAGFFLKVTDAEDGIEWAAPGELEGVGEAPGDGVLYGRKNGAWQAVVLYPPVVTEAGTSLDMLASHAGSYIRFTNTAAKTLNVQPDADEPLAANSEYHIRNAAANDLTIVAGSGVTINAPADGTLVVPNGGTVTLKRAAEDVFDLLGHTVPA